MTGAERLAAVSAVIGAVGLVIAAIALYPTFRGGGDGGGKNVVTPPAPSQAAKPCVEQTSTAARDPRFGRVWNTVFACTSNPGAPVYEKPDGTVIIGYLDTEQSWFVCWTRGQHHTSDDIWYYTQGDRATAHPEHKAWGYTPSTTLTHSPAAPAPGLTRTCPSPP
ncbi:hypothetical protein GCM10027589_36980 [Actinocorallia lasiicapitis]